VHDLTSAYDDLKAYEVDKLILHPELWRKLTLSVLLQWIIEPFNRKAAARIPDVYGGVYAFVVQPGIANFAHASYLLYIGKTEGKEGFRQRYKQYLTHSVETKTRRPRLRRMFDHWPNHLWFCYARVNLQGKQLEAIENSLLGAFLPPYNGEFPGEVGKARNAW
jgi:hypothetical protein